MISISDFLEALTDKDLNNISRTTIAVDCELLDLKTQETKTLASAALQKPVITVEKHGEYVQLDFEFISALDSDLKLFWNTLEMYGKTSNDVNTDTTKTGLVATSSITMLPTTLEGKYFAIAVNPIFWALTSKDVGVNANIIRIMVSADNFNIYENINVDTNAIERAVDDEIAYQARMSADQNNTKI